MSRLDYFDVNIVFRELKYMYAAEIKISDDVSIHWSAYGLVFLLVGLLVSSELGRL